LNSERYTRPALWRDFSAPAAALAQTPAAGIARVLMFALCGLCLGLLLWAWLSRIEILANAPGKVVVVGQNKSIQSLVPGVVSELWVEEGERVLAGQPLLTLAQGCQRGAEPRRTRHAGRVAVVAQGQGDTGLLVGQCLDRRGGCPGDDEYVSPVGDEHRHPALRHRAAPDHDDLLACQT
jgi:hypothetical protein